MVVCVCGVPAGSQEGIDLEAAEAEKQAKEKAAAEKRYQSLEELFIKELGITEDYLAEARAAEEAALKTVHFAEHTHNYCCLCCSPANPSCITRVTLWTWTTYM